MSVNFCSKNHHYNQILIDGKNQFHFYCPNCKVIPNSTIINIDGFQKDLQEFNTKYQEYQRKRADLFLKIETFLEEKMQNIQLQQICQKIAQIKQIDSFEYKELLQLFKVVYDDKFSESLQHASQKVHTLLQSFQALMISYIEPSKPLLIEQQQISHHEKLSFQQIQKAEGHIIYHLPPSQKIPHSYAIAILKKQPLAAITFGDKHPLVIFDYLTNKIEHYLDEGAYDVIQLPNEYLILSFANKIAVYDKTFMKTDLQQKCKCTRIIYSEQTNFVIGTDIMTQLGLGTNIFTWKLETNEVFLYKLDGRSGGGLTVFKDQCFASEIVEVNKVSEGRIHNWKLGEVKAVKILRVIGLIQLL